MGKTAILDYDAGNQTSVERAVRHLGFEGQVTRDPRAIRKAERVIFPGVGAAAASMENLRQLELDGELRAAVEEGKPVLGICIGCQVIFGESEEDDSEPTKLPRALPGRCENHRRFAYQSRKFPYRARPGAEKPGPFASP